MNDTITSKTVLNFENPPKLSRDDRARLDAMDDNAIARAASDDPDNPVLTYDELQEFRPVSDAREVRLKLKLTQEAFAKRFHIPVGTLRDWEQHRTEPDTTARSLIKLISVAPELVESVLAQDKSPRNT
ncbi:MULTISPECIES: helix-turn-helix domain-containing protein [Thalassospira]|jgi:putative transcriptional regulator|uniref:helix-turn-helix domain-containing protein n=1 Tax=Thalassospira TaxID=168934 RepID=UPI000B2526ED|nr:MULTISPECIES: helix-turn-helix domain-containing protein [Thalassospira]MDM7976290.1 helix-turn-helix domain-containing protein [Thalassospira xiamenensis]|tara:strand:+ start:137 stop:523 length:387 start_codon:yes stop_codon:yes gene_type:complete